MNTAIKKILGVIVGLFLCSTLYAKDASWQIVIDSQTVNGTATVYSNPLVVGSYSDFSYVIMGSSGATVDVKLEIQILPTNSSDFDVINTTNDFTVGASTDVYQGTWTDLNTGGVLYASYTSSFTPVADGFSLPVTRMFRFKLTGNASNGIDSQISVILGRYSERR